MSPTLSLRAIGPRWAGHACADDHAAEPVDPFRHHLPGTCGIEGGFAQSALPRGASRGVGGRAAGLLLQDIVPIDDRSPYEELLRYETEARALGYPELQ